MSDDYFPSFQLWFSWFLRWLAIFDHVLGILVIRLGDWGSYLNFPKRAVTCLGFAQFLACFYRLWFQWQLHFRAVVVLFWSDWLFPAPAASTGPGWHCLRTEKTLSQSDACSLSGERVSSLQGQALALAGSLGRWLQLHLAPTPEQGRAVSGLKSFFKPQDFPFKGVYVHASSFHFQVEDCFISHQTSQLASCINLFANRIYSPFQKIVRRAAFIISRCLPIFGIHTPFAVDLTGSFLRLTITKWLKQCPQISLHPPRLGGRAG